MASTSLSATSGHNGEQTTTGTGPESITELEQEVLEEYATLLDNLNKVCNFIVSC
jgi:hypothetical protein